MERKVLVIDVGGSYIKYGLIDKECKISNKGKLKTPYLSQEHFLETLKELYIRFKDNISGIAISAPGLIDVEKGIMKTGGMLTYLDGIHLVDKLSKLCDNISVSIENDAKAAALCEAWIGAGKDNNNIVSLTFGSGIGGGVVINRQIYRGNHLIAGEFSPILCDFTSGSFKNFASEYSTIAVVNKVKERKYLDDLDGETVMKMYANNDTVVKEILNEWFESIAKFCTNIDCLYNPDCICIGGGISVNQLFMEKIYEYLDYVIKNAYVFRKPVVKSCQYHNNSNLIGAYYAYCQKYYKEGENL